MLATYGYAITVSGEYNEETKLEGDGSTACDEIAIRDSGATKTLLDNGAVIVEALFDQGSLIRFQQEVRSALEVQPEVNAWMGDLRR